MDLKREIVNLFQKEGMLIQPEAVEFLISRGNGIEFCKKFIRKLDVKPLIVSVDFLRNFVEGEKQEVKKIKPVEKIAPVVKVDDDGFEVLQDITGNSTCEGHLNDFVSLFKDRFEKLSKMLRKRQEMRNAVPIKKIWRSEDEIATIGLVKEVRNAKNGLIVEIEDEEDMISVYVPKEIDPAIVNDEVIGVVGKRKGDLLIARSIVRPELPIEKEKKLTNEERYIAFISDLHVGSKSFLERKWEKFIKWINGKGGSERQRKVAEKIEYLIISGDDVEGVGIYPDQEKDLDIEDIYKQYEDLAGKLSQIPERIKIILQPGNHDAVRPALPQPAFEKEIRELFTSNNIEFVGNPCYMKINGVTVLAYHGQSIQDFASCIPGLNQNEPTKIMKEMLRRRHLAPIYGGISSLAPERRDYLIIDYIPDIFVTGHVHVTAVDSYRGVLMINASAWQSQTDYQKMMNFMPDPGKAVVVNLKNFMPSIVAF